MLNTVKLALAATVAAATGTLANFADEVAPASVPVSQPAFQLASGDKTNPLAKILAAVPQEKRVTVRIQGTIDDVVKWMGDTGISFVLENKGLATRKVTINLVDQPIDDAIAAIAEALGTGWSKRGQVYVLGTQDAIAPRVWSVPRSPVAPKAKVHTLTPEHQKKLETELKRAYELAEKSKSLAPNAFHAVPTTPGLTDKQRKAFELEMKKLHELKVAPNVRVYTDVKDMSDKERKAFEEAMKGLHSLPHMKDLKGYREMTPAEQKKFEDSMRKFEIEMHKLGDDMKVYTMPHLNDADRNGRGKDLPVAPTVLRTGTMEELMKSLTPDQRTKHEQQGFLKFSDLSGAQKKMLGSPKGNFTISFNLNGKQLTIKNP